MTSATTAFCAPMAPTLVHFFDALLPACEPFFAEGGSGVRDFPVDYRFKWFIF